MKRPNITPGPWIDKGDCEIRSKDGNLIADTESHSYRVQRRDRDESDYANARAIAAVPALLEALESALPMLVECNPQDPDLWNNEEHCPQDHPNCCLACATFYKIRSALIAAGYKF